MSELEPISPPVWYLAQAAAVLLAGTPVEALEVYLLRAEAAEEGRLSEPEFRKVQRQYLDQAVERIKILLDEIGGRPLVRWNGDRPEIQPWPPAVD